MKAACYCRISTEKESQISSYQKQKEFFEELALSKGYDFEIYGDEGLSGKQTKNRTQFLRMIKDAKQKKFNEVWVKDISRFARNTEDFIHNIRKIKSYGINVFFINQNMDIQEGSEFYLTILAAMAQEESAKLSERVKFGKNHTAKRGRVPNFVFGYDKGIGSYNLTINPKEQEIVLKIFDMFINEGIGTGKIAGWLNQNKVLTKKNKVSNWYQTVVVQILRNKIYIGKIINKKSEVIRRELPENEYLISDRPDLRIVSDEDFYKAEAILESRRNAFKMSNKRESYKYPFSTLIKCSECGYSFKRNQRQYKEDGKIYIKWVCSQRNAKGVGACINDVFIKDEDITKATKVYLDGIIQNKKALMSDITKKVKNIIDERNNNTITNRLDIERKLNTILNKKQKYMEMYTNEIITITELKDYTKEMNIEKDKLEIKLNLMQNSNVVITDIGKIISNYFTMIEDLLNADDLKNEKLKQVLEYKCFPDGTIRFDLKIISNHDLNITVPLTNIFAHCNESTELFINLA